MKVGVSYNVWDGYEILEWSIKTIRPCVEYINVVMQEVSNWGNKLPENLESQREEILDRLVKQGYINEIIQFTPDLTRPVSSVWVNEMNKRQIGYDTCSKHGCTHYMSADADEIYKPSELNAAMQIIEEGNYDGAVCRYSDHYGDVNLRWGKQSGTWVPFIYKIDDNRKFKHCSINNEMKMNCDPTRQMPCKKLIKFDGRKIIHMRHMNMVRSTVEEIKIKYYNSTARCNNSKASSKIAKLEIRLEKYKKYLETGETEYELVNKVDNNWIIK